jgi:hypothetical protein
MECATRSCGRYGHAEFVVEVGDVPQVDATWLIGYLEDAVAEGTVFAPGETIQIGWMITRIELAPAGRLTLYEPDLRSLPVRFVPGTAATLRHLRAQRNLADAFGLGDLLQFPSIADSAIACTHYDRGHDWVLSRVEPEVQIEGRDCGWFVGCAVDSHDHDDPVSLERISLYQIAMRVPEIVEYLALPPSCEVIVRRGGEPMVAYDGEVLTRKG